MTNQNSKIVFSLHSGQLNLCLKNAELILMNNTLTIRFVRFVLAAVLLVTVPAFGTKDTVSKTSSDTFGTVCKLIYEGRFDNASQLLEKIDQDKSPLAKNQNLAYGEIAEITKDFAELGKKRASEKQNNYKKKWDKLQSLHWRADADNVEDVNDVGDVNDVNDVNEPAEVFWAVVSLLELADKQQKKQILAEPVLTEATTRATETAAEYEAQGKWLDAYSQCYYWLKEINPDNKQYSEHADELLDRAAIVSSFADSPCETARQRFEKIEPLMFKRAMEVIGSNYVDPVFLDYGKMATVSIKRCRLLAEVIKTSYADLQESRNGDLDQEQILRCPDSNSLLAWSTGLDLLKEQIETAQGSVSKDKFFEVFDAIRTLNCSTVKLPESILIAHFAEATLSVLDQHTVIIWPAASSGFKKDLTGEFAGIGILITREKGLLTAASLLPDTPAYKSGLDAGDIIEAVDGEPTKNISLNCVVKMITGPAGTTVRLTVRSPQEEETRDLVITRAKILVRTIRGWQRTTSGQWQHLIDEERKIGYIRLFDKFSEDTSGDMETVLNRLEKEQLRGLVLDLRYNQGGLLDSAVDVVDKFIDKGLIVRTQPRWGLPDYRIAKSGGTHPDYPVVVLVNSASASASEIVAGALGDPKYRRAVIVGERTHGKGSVQTITFRPGNGAMLKYTMGYYHLPSGQRVNSREHMEKLDRDDWGIAPDVSVKLTAEEEKKLLLVQRDNDVLVKAGHDITAAPLKKHSLAETLDSDPQLAVALLIIRTKLLEQDRSAPMLSPAGAFSNAAPGREQKTAGMN